MTALPSMSLTGPAGAGVDDRYIVLSEPRRNRTVNWLPGHVLTLADGGHEFHFLVFSTDGQDATAPLRFERRHPEREIAHEVCELLVLAVSDGVRTSSPASPRTA